MSGWVKNGVSLKRTHLSPDGRWALSAAEDGRVRVWPILYSPPPAPGWLPELAEALAGGRLRDDGTLQQIPPERWFALNKSLGASTSDDFYARWAKWFFVERGRTSRPHSCLDLTRSQIQKNWIRQHKRSQIDEHLSER